MMVLRLLLILPFALCFAPQTQRTTRSREPEHLRYIGSEKSFLFTSSRESTQIPNNTPHSTLNEASAKHVMINNRHSASDWLYNLKSLPKSSVLQEIKNPVITLAAWATFISVVQKVLLWSGKTKAAMGMCIAPAAHSFLVSSLGLLLVFRTNSAYQRFLEGRKIWEEILAVSRNLSRLATLYRVEVGSERLGRMKNLLASFPYLLRHHIRSGCLCNKDSDSMDDKFKLLLQEPSTQVVDSRYEGDTSSGGAYRPSNQVALTRCYVDRRDLPWNLLDDPKKDTLLRVAQATNRPLWLSDRLGQEIMGISYGPNFTSRERLTMLSSVDKLTNAIGQCERIHQTAVPLNYARHALRSLTLWLFTLPFCLVKDMGLLTGPVTAIMAWLLFGVYQIGHSIEDPFQGSLRLSMLCDAIRRDVLADDGIAGPRESAFSLDHGDEEDDLDFDEPVVKSSEKVEEEEDVFIFPHPVVDVVQAAPKLTVKNGTWAVVV